jgi:RHH-type rel operon transcriptional repressor/antitoxin RelB
MERQLTVRIPADLAKRLDRAERVTNRRRSELVRLALEQFLQGPGGSPAVRPIDLVRDLIGSIDTGIPDLAERHREYLSQRLRRGRSADS